MCSDASFCLQSLSLSTISPESSAFYSFLDRLRIENVSIELERANLLLGGRVSF